MINHEIFGKPNPFDTKIIDGWDMFKITGRGAVILARMDVDSSATLLCCGGSSGYLDQNQGSAQILVQTHCYMGVVQNYGTRKRPYAARSRTFRALSRPSRIGTWDYDQVFVYLRFINNGIQTFREPYAALSRLSPLQQNIHIHICRCHSDTKSLAWVLGRLPYAKMSVPCQRHLSTGHILLAASCGQRMLVHSWPGFKAIHQSN